MASALYPSFKEGLLNKEHDLDTDVIKVMLISTSDEPSYTSTDSVLTDIAGGPYGASTAETIPATISITDGVFDGGDVTFSSVAIDGAKDVDVLILYNDTHASDALIAWIDGFSAVTPNGGDITITWGANIFSL